MQGQPSSMPTSTPCDFHSVICNCPLLLITHHLFDCNFHSHLLAQASVHEKQRESMKLHCCLPFHLSLLHMHIREELHFCVYCGVKILESSPGAILLWVRSSMSHEAALLQTMVPACSSLNQQRKLMICHCVQYQ